MIHLTGGPGKDTFNCGVGIDTVTDSNATEGGDILTNIDPRLRKYKPFFYFR